MPAAHLQRITVWLTPGLDINDFIFSVIESDANVYT
jgi:hypothetical protein